jgi:hypothetical protein
MSRIIVVDLPSDRRKRGLLQLLHGGANGLTGLQSTLYIHALGKSDNAQAAGAGNPSRNPLLRYGDTPTGLYQGELAGPFTAERRYGPHNVLRLTPIGGNALLAQRNGRSGIAIHGGDLREGQLRPTLGCVRVSNEAMADIVEFVGSKPVTVLIVEDADSINHTVHGDIIDSDPGDEEGDPEGLPGA